MTCNRFHARLSLEFGSRNLRQFQQAILYSPAPVDYVRFDASARAHADGENALLIRNPSRARGDALRSRMEALARDGAGADDLHHGRRFFVDDAGVGTAPIPACFEHRRCAARVLRSDFECLGDGVAGYAFAASGAVSSDVDPRHIRRLAEFIKPFLAHAPQ